MARVRDLWHDARTGARTARYGKGKRWLAITPHGVPDKAFERKVDADRHGVTVEAEHLRGEYVDRSDRRTVSQAAREHAAARPHGPRTARRIDSLIRTHIEPTPLGRRRLADVRPSEVQAWATDRSRMLAPSTLRSLVSLLRSVYAAAVIDREGRLLARRPAATAVRAAGAAGAAQRRPDPPAGSGATRPQPRHGDHAGRPGPAHR